MIKSIKKQSSYFIVVLFGIIILISNFTQCADINKSLEYPKTHNLNNSTSPDFKNKQKGAHVFGRMDSTNVQPLSRDNYNWITIVSWGHQKATDSPMVEYLRGDQLRNARRDSIWKNKINIAHSQGFKVFFKPHIWLTDPANGKWRSDIFPTDEHNWVLWKNSYRTFILHYARIAQENNVELFCVGTELSRLTVEKSEFWIDLIKDIRQIYSGKLTYAANWHNEYEKITFWGDLDFIGIQAYFPLVKNNNPTVQQVSKGWDRHIPQLESIHNKYNRKILFTELGYKSTADSAIQPWEWIDYNSKKDKPLSLETQANCYEAFFNSIWDKEWFTGVHIWQWRCDFNGHDGKDSLDFTPRGKPAEKIIANGFRTD